MAKVKVIAKDESGKDVPFFTKTLTKEFKGKAGKKYGISIQEPNQPVLFVGDYTVQGAVIPDPHQCQEHEHWDDTQQKCVPDLPPPPPECPEGQHKDENGNCIPDVVECPPGQHKDASGNCVPDSPPGEGLLYDSNTDIDWGSITGEFLKVTDVYGDFRPNGKYFRMKASGNPRMYLYPATKELVLEHDGSYGRAYFGVCNYQSRLECEFKLDSTANNASFKTRNRHQYADIVKTAADKERQGGQGSSFASNKVDADLEVVHGTELSGPSKALNPPLEANKWYKIRFSQYDKDNEIHIVDELDRGDGKGFQVVNEGDVGAPPQFFNRGQFETFSEFWVRLNADKGGRLTFKNLKMYKIG